MLIFCHYISPTRHVGKSIIEFLADLFYVTSCFSSGTGELFHFIPTRRRWLRLSLFVASRQWLWGFIDMPRAYIRIGPAKRSLIGEYAFHAPCASICFSPPRVNDCYAPASSILISFMVYRFGERTFQRLPASPNSTLIYTYSTSAVIFASLVNIHGYFEDTHGICRL